MEDDQQGDSGGQGGGLTDELMNKGREMASDPQNQERLRNMAEERLGIGGGGEGAGDQGAGDGGDSSDQAGDTG